MAPNNLAYRAYERYFEEEIISRPRRVGEGGDGLRMEVVLARLATL